MTNTPQTSSYEITSAAGQHIGIWQAESEQQALDLMAQDAGYRDEADMIEQTGVQSTATVSDFAGSTVTKACEVRVVDAGHHEPIPSAVYDADDDEDEDGPWTCDMLSSAISTFGDAQVIERLAGWSEYEYHIQHTDEHGDVRHYHVIFG